MIAAGITLGLVAAVLTIWWAVRYFAEWGKHGGVGEGTLTVQQLLDQAAAEDHSGGRHRLREPVVTYGDLAEDLANYLTDQVTIERTQELPRVVAMPIVGGWARDLDSLRQVYAGLQRL